MWIKDPMAIIEDSDPVDGEARCPRCGAKVLELDYCCPRCAQVLTWKKPDKDEAPSGDEK